MPAKPDIKLDISTKDYTIADGRAITVWNIISPEDPKFHFQLRFIQNNDKKINLNKVKSTLPSFIDKTTTLKPNKLLFNKKYECLKFLEGLGFDSKSTRIIQNGSVFKVNDSKAKALQESKDLSALVVTDIFPFQNNSEILHFGYEIKNFSKNNAPLCCVSFFSNENLTKKLYLFPSNEDSLKNAVTLLKKNPHKLQALEIPYVEYLPSKSSEQNYDNDIQTRINLQTIISEILTHLEKPSFFRKNSSEKVNIFRNLAKSIANSEALDNISSQFNAHDT